MTTNNHPAHGPVSLDRLHQIREILSKASEQSDGGNLGYAMADAVKVIDGAIAEFGAEPAAEIREDLGRLFVKIIHPSTLKAGDKLYATPPAPRFVPSELTREEYRRRFMMEDNFDDTYRGGWNAFRAAMLQAGNHTEQHLDMVDHFVDANEKCKDVTLINEGNIPATQIKPVADLYGITSPTGSETTLTFDSGEASSFAKGGWSVQEYVELERYQQAVVGNSPVTPDTWIPVSERMPEDDDFVQVWPRPDFGVELHVGQYLKSHKKGAGWYAQINEQNYGIEWYPINVTHWMPLPSSPM